MNGTPGLPVPPRPCLTCATPTTNRGQRCDQHQREHRQAHRTKTAYYHTREWQDLRTACLTRDHHQCVVCTGTYRLTAHHITARNQGGADTLPNLVTLCHPCHSRIERDDQSVRTRLAAHLHHSPHHTVRST